MGVPVVLEIRDLGMSFGGLRALDSVNLAVPHLSFLSTRPTRQKPLANSRSVPFVMMALVAVGTLNSSATYFRTAVNGASSGTETLGQRGVVGVEFEEERRVWLKDAARRRRGGGLQRERRGRCDDRKQGCMVARAKTG